MSNTLYKRNAKGDIIFWSIQNIGEETVKLHYGKFGTDGHLESFRSKNTAEKEIKSRLTAKRKEGYKLVSELRDNAPTSFIDTNDLRQYLETYLPADNTTLAGDKFCMLCKTLEDNTPFEKHSYNGQYKINGERCIVHLEKTTDMFKPYRCIYTSRRGNDWTPKLYWMDEIIIPALKEELITMMLEEGASLDGELYIPGYAINEVNSIIKNDTLPQHKLLQYWVYDIAIENMPAETRYETLRNVLNAPVIEFNNAAAHLNNSRQLLILPSFYVSDINNAIQFRNDFINYGFEGLVIRDIDAEYQFGKRNNSMLKYKKVYDGYFKVVDIQPQSRKNNLPLFTLKNDINGNTFECTLNGTHAQQASILATKDDFIGKKVFVEYRERSGVKEVPFHAKIISMNDDSDMKPVKVREVPETPQVKVKPKKLKLKI